MKIWGVGVAVDVDGDVPLLEHPVVQNAVTNKQARAKIN